MGRSKLRFALILGAVAALATAAICGGSSDSGQATPVSEEEYRAAAEAALEAILLTANDFPAGWAGAPSEPDADDPAGDAAFRAALSSECQASADLFDTDNVYPGAVTWAGSDLFNRSDPNVSTNDIESSAGVYRTAEDALNDWNQSYDFLENCADELPAAMTAAFAADPETAGVMIEEITFTEVDAPAFGEESRRWAILLRFTNSGSTYELSTYASAVRQGRIVATIEWLDWGDLDEGIVDALTGLLATRISEADARLPE